MNTLLIGVRTSGKSTIGRDLAARFALPFVDLDDIVRAAFDEPTVSEIWARHGESAWREAEAEAVEGVLLGRRQIIALGGGTPMIESARQAIEEARRAGTARAVYLRVDAVEAERRLREAPGDRPSLTGVRPADEIARVMAEREPTYRALADVTIDTTGRTVSEIVDRLASQVGDAAG